MSIYDNFSVLKKSLELTHIGKQFSMYLLNNFARKKVDPELVYSVK